ncbi:MAG: hypothetical protein QOD58_2905 [Mycobacterium sp.]|jgi:hypothetical protein|nr:hypothetical protein [Mycobacterium sp.]
MLNCQAGEPESRSHNSAASSGASTMPSVLWLPTNNARSVGTLSIPKTLGLISFRNGFIRFSAAVTSATVGVGGIDTLSAFGTS